MGMQNIADQIKGKIEQYSERPRDMSPEERRRYDELIDLVQRFGAVRWHGPAWDDAIAVIEGVRLEDEIRLIIDPAVDGPAIVDELEKLMNRFLVYSGHPKVQGHLTMAEAAAYLNVSVRTMKYHMYKSKKLVGQVVKDVLYQRDELDEFAADWPTRGRPIVEPDTAD